MSRFTRFSVVDRSGRVCYRPDPSPLNLELELLALERETRGLFKLMVDVGEYCYRVLGFDQATHEPIVDMGNGIVAVAE